MTPDEVKELMNKGLITQVIDPVDIVNNMETPPMGGCECTDYVLPVATSTTLGGVKVGGGLTASSDGKLSINIGTGLNINSSNGLSVPTATKDSYGSVMIGAGLNIGNDNKLNIGSATSAKLGGIKVGNNLSISSDGTLSATDTKYNNASTSAAGLMSKEDKSKLDGITAGANKYTLPPATTVDLGGVKVGNNLSISSDGTLSATDTKYNNASTSAAGLMSKEDKSKLDGITAGANKYTLPPATTTTLGGIMVGTGLYINNGEIGAYYATKSTSGMVKIGDGLHMKKGNWISVNCGTGLSIGTDEKLYVTGSGYELPEATTTTLGGVKIGTTLTVDNDGVIEIKFPSKSGMKFIPGGSGSGMDEGWYINYGDGLTIDAEGKLNVTGGGSGYKLGTASKTTLGGIKIGTGFDSGSVQLGIDDKTGIAGVSCRYGLKVNNNSHCIEVDIDYIYQQILTKLQNDGYLQ